MPRTVAQDANIRSLIQYIGTHTRMPIGQDGMELTFTPSFIRDFKVTWKNRMELRRIEN